MELERNRTLRPFWNDDCDRLTNHLWKPQSFSKSVVSSEKKQLITSYATNNSDSILDRLHSKTYFPSTLTNVSTEKKANVAECQENNCNSKRFSTYKVCLTHYNTLKESKHCYNINTSGKKKGERCRVKAKDEGLCYRHLSTKQTEKVIYSRMIKLLPTEEQSKVLKQWFGVSRKVYNTVLVMTKRKKPQSLPNLRIRVSKHPMFKKKYIKETPSEVIDSSISDFIKAKSNAILKYKTTKKISQLTFRKKRDESQSIVPYSRCVVRTLNDNNRFRLVKIYGRRLSAIKTKEDVPEFGSCRIVMKYAREFYLKVDIEYKKQTKNEEIEFHKCIALDPNVKNFFGYYSHRSAGVIGENVEDVIYRFNKRISKLQSIRDKEPTKRKKKTLQRKLQFLYKKRANVRDDIHWKVIKEILDNYDMVILPEFEAHKKCQGLASSTNQRMFNLAHSMFMKRLKYKAEKQGKYVLVPGEEYTSKTCSCCGEYNVPNDRYYKCVNCDFTFHRDVNAAVNIFIKGLLTL